MKNIQISLDLFDLLCKQYLLDIVNTDDTESIKKSLEQKLDSLVRHELYTKYKTAATAEEQERARIEYLDKVGMHKDFRY